MAVGKYSSGKLEITYRGKKYKRWPMGLSPLEKAARKKGDLGSKEGYCECGVDFGEYHDLGCDCETCPICKGQLLSCGHLNLFKPKEQIVDDKKRKKLGGKVGLVYRGGGNFSNIGVVIK